MFKILFFLLSTPLFAANLQIFGPCSEEAYFQSNFDLSAPTNLGAFSVEAFTHFGIPFIGNERGMNSIINTPTGIALMEIVSENEMYAYGWCYSINGIEPNIYADEVPMSDLDSVKWWFAYAHYLNGEWVSQCEPANLRKENPFCRN